MINKRQLLLITAIHFIGISASAQDDWMFGTGLIEDNEAYEQIPQKAVLITRDYTILPDSFSLRKYCPKAGSQGIYGTCTAWASTYAARTIAEAIKWGWTDTEIISEEAYAPLFVYAQTKVENDNECTLGARMDLVLKFMKTNGAAKIQSFNYQCADFIPRWVHDEAIDNTIDDYFTIFGHRCQSADEKISKVKKSLSQERPVVINMHIPRSFRKAGEIWAGSGMDGDKPGYHAMCVVGYDNNKAGGAFQIMNSWGEKWGDKGFTWVKYADFAKYVDWAFELYVKKAKYPEMISEKLSAPKPVKTVIDDTSIDVEANNQSKNDSVNNYEEKAITELSGKMHIQLLNGETMELSLRKEKLPYYHAKGRFVSGTRFRIYLSNNEPAYVYVLGWDLTNNVTPLFPQNKISPALVYKSNDIALPSEDASIRIDETQGKDYLCVLYSGKELPFESIIKRIKQKQGSFTEKLAYALEEFNSASTEDITYAKHEISFKAETTGSVVPLIVEIPHN